MFTKSDCGEWNIDSRSYERAVYDMDTSRRTYDELVIMSTALQCRPCSP